MAFNFFKTKKEEIFLVLDIGTEAVKALIFEKENKKVIILGAATQYFEKYGVFDGKDFKIDVMERAISKAIEEAYQTFIIFSKTKIGSQNWKRWPVLLGLPVNILKARVVCQSFSRKKPKEKISQSEQEFIYQECFKKAQREISQRFAEESGILPEDIQWITQKILEIKIEGYQVSELQGYEGKDLEFKILATFLPEYYFNNIKRIFEDLQLKILKRVHIAENLPNILVDKKMDGIFFDVGGEITQIFLVNAGSLCQVNEFEVGGKIFSQRLSETLGIEEASARNLKERYSDKLLSVGATERVKEIFLQEKRNWDENLKLKIKEISPKALLSLPIFLFGGGGLLPEIQEIFKKNGIGVKFIYPKYLKDIEDLTKKVKSPQYIPSLLISYYAKKIL